MVGGLDEGLVQQICTSNGTFAIKMTTLGREAILSLIEADHTQVILHRVIFFDDFERAGVIGVVGSCSESLSP